jgi:hypothetical protein
MLKPIGQHHRCDRGGLAGLCNPALADGRLEAEPLP